MLADVEVPEAEERLAAEREVLREAEAESTVVVSEAREAVQTLKADPEERERAIEALRAAQEDLSVRLATSEATRYSPPSTSAPPPRPPRSARTEGPDERPRDARRPGR